MMDVIFLSVVLFASTNIDDIFVLITFMADRQFRLHQIVIGQYLGIAALFISSVLASLVSLVWPAEIVGLLGFLPILIGLLRLTTLLRGGGDTDDPQLTQPSAILAVATVTIANGGDNIAVYTPAFATQSAANLAVIAAGFIVLTALWLMFAHWLVNHPQLGRPIRRYGERLVPFVLIGLGVMVLEKTGSAALLARLIWP